MSKKSIIAGLTFSIGAYLFFTLINIYYPGINYDEIFFGNAALGGLDNTFIFSKIGKIPLFLHNYIGAFKSWIYFPIFKLFGVNAISIRIPVIVFTASALVLLFITVQKMFNAKTALLAVLFTSIDPSIIHQTRVDYGPVVLSFLLRILILFFFHKGIQLKQFRYIFIALIFVCLGFFNKMDFVWFAAGIIFSSILFYGKELQIMWNKLNNTIRRIIFIFAAGVCIAGLFLLVKIRFFDFIDLLYLKHLVQIIISTWQMVQGQWFYTYLFGDLSPMWKATGFVYAATCVLLVGTNFIYRLYYKNTKRTHYFFLVTIVFLTFFQIIITSNAGSSWHLYYMYPIYHILLADSFVSLYEKVRGIKRLILFMGALFILYSVCMNFLYVQNYGKELRNAQWSKAIYELVSLSKQKNNTFVSVDWGTHNQMLIFNQEKNKYFDEWVWFIKDPIPEKEYKRLLSQHFENPKTLFVMYSSDKSNLSRTRKMFFQIAQNNRYKTVMQKIIKDDNAPVYELYSVTKYSP